MSTNRRTDAPLNKSGNQSSSKKPLEKTTVSGQNRRNSITKGGQNRRNSITKARPVKSASQTTPPPPPQEEPSQDLIMSTERALAATSRTFELCRNRLWGVIKNISDDTDRDTLLRILLNPEVGLNDCGKHKDHMHCTVEICEHWRLNTSDQKQLHECGAPKNCDSLKFKTEHLKMLDKAVRDGKPTAWKLDRQKLLATGEEFMAISHCWADGTGRGEKAIGEVNSCLYNLFEKVARDHRCAGIWWDVLCVPSDKELKATALARMQTTYQDAKITLVHDLFLREWQWNEDKLDVTRERACFAILLSPWFSRGWTALELMKSKCVKVMFKDGEVKDLEEDILARDGDFCTPAHKIASRLIKNVWHPNDRNSQREVKHLDQLISVLGHRDTSVARDMAFIAGQLAGLRLKKDAFQQAIYQAILHKFGHIHHDHLFHYAVTMAHSFTWCPSNLFKMPRASYEGRPGKLEVHRNGNLTGKWNVFPFHLVGNLRAKCSWFHVPSLVKDKVVDALDEVHGPQLFKKLVEYIGEHGERLKESARYYFKQGYPVGKNESANIETLIQNVLKRLGEFSQFQSQTKQDPERVVLRFIDKVDKKIQRRYALSSQVTVEGLVQHLVGELFTLGLSNDLEEIACLRGSTILLVDPEISTEPSTPITQAIVVRKPRTFLPPKFTEGQKEETAGHETRTRISDEKETEFQFAGAVRFHPPLRREDLTLGMSKSTWREEITILGTIDKTNPKKRMPWAVAEAKSPSKKAVKDPQQGQHGNSYRGSRTDSNTLRHTSTRIAGRGKTHNKQRKAASTFAGE